MDKPTPPQSSSAFEGRATLRHQWQVMLERRWLMITVFLAVMLLTGLYLLRSQRVFEVAVRIQIDRESGNLLNVKDVIGSETREQDYLQTQYRNLTSRTLLESVIRDLRLDRDPRYAQAPDKVQALTRDITIAPIRLSRLVDVKVEHSEAKQAQAIANKLAENFVRQNLEQKSQSSFEAVQWLRTQVESSKNQVNQAEEALLGYRKKHNEVSLEEGENIARQQLLTAQEALSRVQIEAATARSAVEEIKRLLEAGELMETIPSIAQNPNVQRLRQEVGLREAALAALLQRYRDKYPAVIAARSEIRKLKETLQEECENQLKTFQNQALILVQQQAALQAKVKQAEEAQFQLNLLRIQYDMLKRDAENSKTIYSHILVREKETELMSRMNSNNIRIVDAAALPLRPVKPRIVLTLCLGIMTGMALALMLAFFAGYMDDSIKSQDDIESILRWPFLGYVPNIKTNSVMERFLQSHLHPQSNAAEGFRTIRATLALPHKAEKLQVLSVTSTIPAEGKSVIASNLGIVHAQTGLRTLLIDADLRRPWLHKAYQLHVATGLSDFLSRRSDDLEVLIKPTQVPNLSLICSGPVPTNPSELIGSPRMLELLNQVKTQFDIVIFDCPPISAVSDPLIISAMSDGVIYVTKFNRVRREHARKSVARLQNAGVHIAGLVINDIDFEGRDAYYYSYYYQNRYYQTYAAGTGDSLVATSAAEKKRS